MSKLSVKEYFMNGGYSSCDDKNFVDWYCNKDDLERRAIILEEKVKVLVELGVIDDENMSVSYKNLSPIFDVYDSISVRDVKNNKELFYILPSDKHESINQYAVIADILNDKSYKFECWDEMCSSLKVNKLA